MQPQPAHQVQPFVPMPGFTVDQTVYVQAYISTAVSISMDWRPSLNAAFNEYFGLPPLQPLPPLQWPRQYTPPAPQAQKEEEKEKPKPLYQATVEDDAEDVTETTPESTKHGNSMLTGSKSHDNKQLFRKWAPHTGFLTTFLATPITSFFGSCLASFSASSSGCSLSSSFGCFLASFSASHVGYIRCMEEMEASGEG